LSGTQRAAKNKVKIRNKIMKTYEVIFKHTSDNNEGVVFQGSKTACKAEIARRKREAKQFHGENVWGWCNGGYSVKGSYWVELREAPAA